MVRRYRGERPMKQGWKIMAEPLPFLQLPEIPQKLKLSDGIYFSSDGTIFHNLLIASVISILPAVFFEFGDFLGYFIRQGFLVVL